MEDTQFEALYQRWTDIIRRYGKLLDEYSSGIADYRYQDEMKDCLAFKIMAVIMTRFLTEIGEDYEDHFTREDYPVLFRVGADEFQTCSDSTWYASCGDSERFGIVLNDTVTHYQVLCDVRDAEKVYFTRSRLMNPVEHIRLHLQELYEEGPCDDSYAERYEVLKKKEEGTLARRYIDKCFPTESDIVTAFEEALETCRRRPYRFEFDDVWEAVADANVQSEDYLLLDREYAGDIRVLESPDGNPFPEAIMQLLRAAGADIIDDRYVILEDAVDTCDVYGSRGFQLGCTLRSPLVTVAVWLIDQKYGVKR